MFQLARTLRKDKELLPVIVTATSHLGAWQTQLADRHIIAESPTPIEAMEHGLQGLILVTGGFDGDRTNPLDDRTLKWLNEFCGYHSIPLLIEADGSRGKPLKAWAEHEPPIPSFADHVVQVVGLSGLGKSLNEDHVHRPELFSRLSGLTIGETVTSAALARVLTNPEGGLKNIPDRARRVILLNQADTVELQAATHGLVHPLLSGFHSVIVSSLEQEEIHAVHEPIAGIILAAGESARFGQPKQLLDWRGKSFVRAVATTALEAGLSPVIVVTGANSERVEEEIKDLNVIIARNDEWKRGQAGSIKAGILSISPTPLEVGAGCGGAIFLLADQPQITTSVIRALVERHAERLHRIVAPMVMDRRANPVLFDRGTLADLITLEGDVGGRGIFYKHRVEYLPWHDDRLLLDVDTPEMYQRLISDESL
jgi:molybdenum cofactor cytidylyltransferase